MFVLGISTPSTAQVVWCPLDDILDDAVGGAESRQALVKGLDPVGAEGGLAADEDGQVDASCHLAFDKIVPFGNVLLLRGDGVLAG